MVTWNSSFQCSKLPPLGVTVKNKSTCTIQSISFTLCFPFELILEVQQTFDEGTAEELEGEVSLDVFKDWTGLSLPI